LDAHVKESSHDMSATPVPDRWQDIREIYERRPAGTTAGIAARDLGTGETLDLNGEHDFPSASTVKVLVAVALAQAFDEERLHPDEKRPVPKEIRLGGSGVVNWLDADLALTLRDHAWLMLAISDNSASNVCIEAVGIEAINAAGQDLGVGGTRLGRRFMGDDAPPGPPKNRATANGLVAALVAIEEDRAASAGQCAWLRACLDEQQHRDRLARHLPDEVTYRGKTGTIELIAHDCGVLTGPNGSIALSVLTHGFENPYDADRFIGRVGTAAAHMLL
jgi:beta-lactamase class A